MGETPKAARREERARLPRFFNLEMGMFTLTVIAGLVLVWSILMPYRTWPS